MNLNIIYTNGVCVCLDLYKVEHLNVIKCKKYLFFKHVYFELFQYFSLKIWK